LNWPLIFKNSVERLSDASLIQIVVAAVCDRRIGYDVPESETVATVV
jgi:hypothetical protein